MSDEFFYPNVKEDLFLPLKVAVQNAKRDPAYLEHPDCPYPPKIKAFINDLITPTAQEGAPATSGSTFLDPGVDSTEVLLKELDRLYTDLMSFRSTLNGMEPNEKATFFKTSMSLLEKIANLKERGLNMKEMADFQRSVITVLEEHFDDKNRESVIQALAKYI